ncbi:hypothetical protein [Streptomyces lavendulae]|uniref:hypothetical protein n=1 Tax=Streptomyces lavendulae TaxID=1914 RepID=UPI0024A11EE8|nr:hypothetical protein [Streptomyces lavendulae]GLX21995.1 hypothetical protein Slala01_56390 [Streptomyces lavendulae subsp. lavendulae]GLX29703.1 hypothetical protein Slala02_55230 [Streptomyces lavendulae subsp. lavendulae]
MNVLLDFAATGRIGPLHCGMPLTGAEEVLGPGRPHPQIVMKGPDFDGYPYAWGGLELVVTRRHVSGISLRLDPGSVARLPPEVLPDAGVYEATVLREDFTAALDAAGCGYVTNAVLTFDEQSAVTTRPAGVNVLFGMPARGADVPDRGRFYLEFLDKQTA